MTSNTAFTMNSDNENPYLHLFPPSFTEVCLTNKNCIYLVCTCDSFKMCKVMI